MMNRRQVRQRRANVETAAEDRLSSLPDSLLLYILDRVAYTNKADILHFEDYIPSRLACMKEAAKTSVLSKQWRFLWTNLPFEFHDHNTDPDTIDKFVARVYASLALRRGPALRSLDFSFSYYDRIAPDVDSWLDFAAKNKVEILNLHLDYAINTRGLIRYTLPQFMYSNPSLTELSLGDCDIIPPTTVDWPCLKKLFLRFVKLGKEAIDLILSGCPVLETLELVGCFGIECLRIRGRSLVVSCNADCRLGQIWAPHVRELELELVCCWIGTRRSLRIKNVPYLEKATVIVPVVDGSIRRKVMRKIIELFQDIRHVKTLHLRDDCIKVISVMASNGWELPQLMVEDLTIDVFAGNVRTIYGVVAILESCPYLKKLAFRNISDITEKASLNWGTITRDDLNCDLLRLKSVEFLNFVNSDFSGELVSTLARILLRRASAVEEIVIKDKTPFMSTEEIDSIKEKLFNYPMSSTKVSVASVRKLN